MKILPCQHYEPLGACLRGSLADRVDIRRIPKPCRMRSIHDGSRRRCCAECPAIGNCGQRKCEDAVKMVKAGFKPGVVK